MTEKDYNPEQKAMKSMKKMKAAEKVATPKVAKEKIETPKKEEIKTENKAIETQENKTEEKKETKKSDQKKPEVKKVKKEFAVVNVSNLPLSTKKSRDFCNFVRGKKLDVAIKEIKEVIAMKRAVPAKGEVSHQKGSGMAGGIYATKTAEQFLVLLNSLLANSNNAEIENPVVAEAIANIGKRPYGRFGRARKKRTHLKLVAREFKGKDKIKNKNKNKEKKQ